MISGVPFLQICTCLVIISPHAVTCEKSAASLTLPNNASFPRVIPAARRDHRQPYGQKQGNYTGDFLRFKKASTYSKLSQNVDGRLASRLGVHQFPPLVTLDQKRDDSYWTTTENILELMDLLRPRFK